MRSRIFLLLLLATPAFGAYAGDAGYVPKAVDLLARDSSASAVTPKTNSWLASQIG
ncbi:MAG: hypothetical protein ABI728_02585 [Betaproteobacteria bacterium]